jgi:hypothetical protein
MNIQMTQSAGFKFAGAGGRLLQGLCLAGGILGAATLTARAQIVVDGTLDPAYGSPLAVQTVNTGFGDSTIGDGTSTGGSELDAAYGTIANGNLYLFLAGNFEDNGNHANIFISDGRPGQSTLALPATGSLQAMNGSKFSPGFQATYALDLNDYQGTAYVEEYSLSGSASGGYVGSFGLTGGIGSGIPGPNGINYGLNNLNAAGVNGNTGTAANPSAADAVTTGLEMSIPLADLGNPAGPVNVLADINGGGDGYLSNQLLPGLPVSSGNLGAPPFNFSGTPGEYFTVPASVPEPSTLALGSLSGLVLLAVRRQRK